jgi:hypothetical protein
MRYTRRVWQSNLQGMAGMGLLLFLGFAFVMMAVLR